MTEDAGRRGAISSAIARIGVREIASLARVHGWEIRREIDANADRPYIVIYLTPDLADMAHGAVEGIV